jgi:geranylgeranyl pyrophosphate synthase
MQDICFDGVKRLSDTSFTNSIQDRLILVEEKIRSLADGNNPTLGAALNHLLASGGKRIRVVVTLLVGEMFLADPERLVTLAAAIEALHTATLVHDDLIDGALIRRGIPTLNAQWSPAATVLTGDFIFAQAARLAANTHSIPVMQLFSETLAIIVNGEITQLFASRWNVDRQNYYRRIYAKTASLFETAASAPGLLCSVPAETLVALKRYGYEIGMAFQIVDDILDFTGAQAIMGKPVASDLRQGLITLPALYYFESYPEDPAIQSMLNSNFCDEECINKLVDSIRKSGVILKSLGEARDSISRAIAALESLPDTPQRKALADLAQYIIVREI